MYDRLVGKIDKLLANSVVKKRAILSPGKKIVSFTFDDFPDSSIYNGAKVLEDYGFRGTFYASLGIANQGDIPSIDDMLNLSARGHELGCHTLSHLSCQKEESKTILKDCRTNKDLAAARGVEFSSFAFPFGEYKPSTKEIIRDMYQSARTVNEGINKKNVDLMGLQAVSIFSDKNAEKRVFNWLNKLDLNGGWLIFYTHEVCNNPTAYGATYDFFSKIVETVAAMNDVSVMPVKEVVNSHLNIPG
mgnify:CR=1 FL=1|tara:strand:- start:5586 stop:6323 length:738 start_codon:yes stop_codon:yes gene_type:complete